MELVINPAGTIRCLYGEEMDLSSLGRLTIQRASYVEPTADGQWIADMSPVSGPVLGPFGCRSAALKAELIWLTEHRLAKEVN